MYVNIQIACKLLMNLSCIKEQLLCVRLLHIPLHQQILITSIEAALVEASFTNIIDF